MVVCGLDAEYGLNAPSDAPHPRYIPLDGTTLTPVPSSSVAGEGGDARGAKVYRMDIGILTCANTIHARHVGTTRDTSEAGGPSPLTGCTTKAR